MPERISHDIHVHWALCGWLQKILQKIIRINACNSLSINRLEGWWGSSSVVGGMTNQGRMRRDKSGKDASWPMRTGCERGCLCPRSLQSLYTPVQTSPDWNATLEYSTLNGVSSVFNNLRFRGSKNTGVVCTIGINVANVMHFKIRREENSLEWLSPYYSNVTTVSEQVGLLFFVHICIVICTAVYFVKQERKTCKCTVF